MPVMNFNLLDDLPPVSFSLKTHDAERMMNFMAECQRLQAEDPSSPEGWVSFDKAMPDSDVPLWLLTTHGDQVESGKYEWRQGWNPARLVTNEFGDVAVADKLFSHWKLRVAPKAPLRDRLP